MGIGIGMFELFILIGIGIFGLAALAAVVYVVIAASKSGNHDSEKPD